MASQKSVSTPKITPRSSSINEKKGKQIYTYSVDKSIENSKRPTLKKQKSMTKSQRQIKI